MSLWIEGSFWDSQIYSGELLLLDNDGAIHHIDWGSVIDGLAATNPGIQTALRVAFSDSDLFYTQKVRKILRDPAIEIVIRQQLEELQTLSVSANRQLWTRYWRVRDTPFPFLPTDTDVYYHQLLAAGDEGLFSSPRGNTGQRGASRTTKHHDGRILQIKASNQNTAVAAAGGGDGLFEFAFLSGSADVLDDPRQIAKIPCSACDWAFQSIVAWSPELAYFASFRQEQDPTSRRTVRSFDRIIRQQQIFEDADGQAFANSRVWGSHEKIFRLSSRGLEVLQYAAAGPSKTRKRSEQADESLAPKPFTAHGILRLSLDPSDVVSTGTAPFGSVMEFPDRLVVLRSDGLVDTFPDEPVHWRVFPRSEHYSNQLHIIYPERIRIVSFVHDYFVEQTSKLTGFARGSNDYIVPPKGASSWNLKLDG